MFGQQIRSRWPNRTECMAQSRGSVREDEAAKMVELCPVKKFGLYSVSRLLSRGGEIYILDT